VQDFINAFLNFEIAVAAAPILWLGFQQTLLLAAMTVPLGLLAGVAFAMLSTRREAWLRWPLMAFIDVFRAIPPLVLLVLLYAGLPFAGLDLGPWGAVAVAFLLNTGAYYAEILRAGIESVPRGQAEAARALGLHRWHVWVFVVLPQAVRNVLPALLNGSVSLQKDVALLSIIGVRDAVREAQIYTARTFNYSSLIGAAVLFLLASIPLARFTDSFARRDRERRTQAIL
jgi:polar amino acid transport system permease protein